jgi:hypothetical protein
MKYLALIALVAAKPKSGLKRKNTIRDFELIEEVREHYRPETVAAFMQTMGEMAHTAAAAEADMQKKWPTMERDMNEFGEWAEHRYGPDFEGWVNSPSVRAVEDHKKAMFHTSKELHNVMSDGFTLYNEFANGGVEMGWGMNADGSYDKWMSNKSVRHVFEELYHLAGDIRKLIESPMGRNQRRLEKLTLNDPHFQSLFAKLQDDIDAHTWGQLEQRLERVGRTIAKELQQCPHFQKMMGLVMKMKQIVDQREISDLDMEGYAKWWNSKNFQNPFAGMKPDDFLL